ncbi:hypothetical protein [Streptomyces sp. RP5T]|uniref:hypothetical protein n=1 Tax=Streptomyces sp. RP5T TaxID=2490848 RepID=UPI000F65222D|nr:hypothetical protein [Streptomyces sp. RP5T]RRR86198.1 hypothetical protein EHS43_05210 [Streptomyces sp. RP5T]
MVVHAQPTRSCQGAKVVLVARARCRLGGWAGGKVIGHPPIIPDLADLNIRYIRTDVVHVDGTARDQR